MKAFVVLSLALAVTQAGFIGGGDGGEAGAPTIPIAVGPGPSEVITSSGPFVGGEAAAVVSGAPSRPRLHEIHTHSSRPVIRVEEYARPNQVIRVHEAPQPAPEVIKVKGPAEPQSLIRVVAKSSGPAHVERVVHRSKGFQVINVQKPAAAPARIVHVVREAAPAPKVEFVQEPEKQSHIYVAQSPAGSEVVLAPRGTSSGPVIEASGYGDAPVLSGPVSSGPNYVVPSNAPVISGFPAKLAAISQGPAVSGFEENAYVSHPPVVRGGFDNAYENIHSHGYEGGSHSSYNEPPQFAVKTKIIKKYHPHH